MLVSESNIGYLQYSIEQSDTAVIFKALLQGVAEVKDRASHFPLNTILKQEVSVRDGVFPAQRTKDKRLVPMRGRIPSVVEKIGIARFPELGVDRALELVVVIERHTEFFGTPHCYDQLHFAFIPIFPFEMIVA